MLAEGTEGSPREAAAERPESTASGSRCPPPVGGQHTGHPAAPSHPSTVAEVHTGASSLPWATKLPLSACLVPCGALPLL